MMDWNPDTKKISPFRHMNFSVPALYGGSPGFLEKLLKDKPKAKIIHIVSHEQRRGFHQIFNEDGTPLLDEFGCQVYLAREVDWQGDLPDIDERFEGTGLLPFD
jgi:hypothetical protein